MINPFPLKSDLINRTKPQAEQKLAAKSVKFSDNGLAHGIGGQGRSKICNTK